MAGKELDFIKLHHIGEPLIAKILEEIGIDGFKKFLGTSDKYLLSSRGSKLISLIETDSNKIFQVFSHIELELGNNIGRDSEHKIDVGIKFETFFLPLEVKMGSRGSMQSFIEFSNYVSDQVVTRNTAKGNRIIKGNMCSVLAKNFKENDIIISAILENSSVNWEYWGIFVRDDVYNKFFEYKTAFPETNFPDIIISIEKFFMFFKVEYNLDAESWMTNFLAGSSEYIVSKLTNSKK